VLPRCPVPLLMLLDDLPTLTHRRAALLRSDRATWVGPAGIRHEPTNGTALGLHGGARAGGALLLHCRLAFAVSHISIGRHRGSTQKETRCRQWPLGGGGAEKHLFWQLICRSAILCGGGGEGGGRGVER
jgi:hypothetical protein